MVQPDAVVVELCASRTQILTVEESELNRISDESGFSQLKKCIKQVSKNLKVINFCSILSWLLLLG